MLLRLLLAGALTVGVMVLVSMSFLGLEYLLAVRYVASSESLFRDLERDPGVHRLQGVVSWHPEPMVRVDGEVEDLGAFRRVEEGVVASAPSVLVVVCATMRSGEILPNDLGLMAHGNGQVALFGMWLGSGIPLLLLLSVALLLHYRWRPPLSPSLGVDAALTSDGCAPSCVPPRTHAGA